MSIEEMTKSEKIEYGQKILKQYKSHAYLADLGIKPILSEDGTIFNLNEFLEVRDKTGNPLSCDTPLEKIALTAPKLVASILEGIHHMKGTYEEKKALFDLYIDRKEGCPEVTEEVFVAFIEAYDDSYMSVPTFRPATEI